MKKSLLLPFLILTFNACRDSINFELQRPVADFIVKNNNCKAPCYVTFTNITKGNDDLEFLWDFGDGDSSRLENPYHLYEYGSEYNIQLIARNKTDVSFSNKKVTVQSDLPVGSISLCRVERVTYIKVPPTKPDGSPWDNLPGNSSRPELQWFVRDTNRIFIRGQELSQLVDFDQKLLPFTVPREGLSGSLRQFNQFYALIIQDADQDGTDTIGVFKFRPIEHFPVQPEKATTPTNFQSEFRLMRDGLEIIVVMNWQ